jgi:hypothetical protein
MWMSATRQTPARTSQTPTATTREWSLQHPVQSRLVDTSLHLAAQPMPPATLAGGAEYYRPRVNNRLVWYNYYHVHIHCIFLGVTIYPVFAVLAPTCAHATRDTRLHPLTDRQARWWETWWAFMIIKRPLFPAPYFSVCILGTNQIVTSSIKLYLTLAFCLQNDLADWEKQCVDIDEWYSLYFCYTLHTIVARMLRTPFTHVCATLGP